MPFRRPASSSPGTHTPPVVGTVVRVNPAYLKPIHRDQALHGSAPARTERHSHAERAPTHSGRPDDLAIEEGPEQTHPVTGNYAALRSRAGSAPLAPRQAQALQVVAARRLAFYGAVAGPVSPLWLRRARAVQGHAVSGLSDPVQSSLSSSVEPSS
jgi:hypothetical protein